jgi:Uma2 family endonuclease
MTLDEFFDYPGEEGYQYELVEGVLVRMVGTRPRAGRVTRKLFTALTAHVQAHGLGTVTQPDEVFDFERSGQKDTGLLPDIGFYHAFREPLVDPDKAYPFAPDLAVEVTSPKQYRPQMQAKALRYLAGGTALVWVLWPRSRQVDVWRRGASAPITLGTNGTLDGEDVVAGFAFPVAGFLT